MKRRCALMMAASVVLLPTARATPEAMAAAIRSFTGSTPLGLTMAASGLPSPRAQPATSTR